MKKLSLRREPKDDEAAAMLIADMLNSGRSLQSCMKACYIKWGWSGEKSLPLIKQAIRLNSLARLDRPEVLGLLLLRADSSYEQATAAGDHAAAAKHAAELRHLYSESFRRGSH